MAAMMEARWRISQETIRQNGWAVMLMTLMTLVPLQLGAKASLDTAADAVLFLAREKRENADAGVVFGERKKKRLVLPLCVLSLLTKMQRRVEKTWATWCFLILNAGDG